VRRDRRFPTDNQLVPRTARSLVCVLNIFSQAQLQESLSSTAKSVIERTLFAGKGLECCLSLWHVSVAFREFISFGMLFKTMLACQAAKVLLNRTAASAMRGTHASSHFLHSKRRAIINVLFLETCK
jgi:hypothetical protein